MEEDLREMKSVLEKVERKLIAIGKIYAAMQFQGWMIAMLIYYMILSIFNWNESLSAAYWILSFVALGVILALFTRKILKKMVSKAQKKNFPITFLIFLSWVIAAIVGWIILPVFLPFENVLKVSFALLSFISLGVFGMFISLRWYLGSFEFEMLPSMVIPILSLFLIQHVSIQPIVFSGLIVALAYSSTVFLYLYSAFKLIE